MRIAKATAKTKTKTKTKVNTKAKASASDKTKAKKVALKPALNPIEEFFKPNFQSPANYWTVGDMRFVPRSKDPRSKDWTGWEHYEWIVNINEQHFDYRTGVGLTTDFGEHTMSDEAAEAVAKLRAAGTPFVWDLERGRLVHAPKIEDVLESLAVDYHAAMMPFDEFHEEHGFDDGLEAFNVYMKAIENKRKLRRAFKDGLNDILQFLSINS